MKNIVLKSLIIFLIGTAGCTPSVGQSVKLDTDAFEKILADKNVQLIDVRTPQEVAGGRIEGAVNMNIADADFQTQLGKLDKNKPVAVYCAVGGRSGRAANILTQMGFKKIYDLSGGMNGWLAKGKKTVK